MTALWGRALTSVTSCSAFWTLDHLQLINNRTVCVILKSCYQDVLIVYILSHSITVAFCRFHVLLILFVARGLLYNKKVRQNSFLTNVKLAAVVSFHNNSAHGSKCYEGLTEKFCYGPAKGICRGECKMVRFLPKWSWNNAVVCILLTWKNAAWKVPVQHHILYGAIIDKKGREILTNTTSIGLSKYQTYNYLEVSKKQNKKKT